MNRFVSRYVLGIAVFWLLGPDSSRADLLTNGSFELGNFNPNFQNFTVLSPGATDMTGWTTTTAELAWGQVPNPYGIVASDGNRFLDLTGYHNSFPYGGVTQTIPTTPGATYTLGLDIGSMPGGGVGGVDGGPVSVQASAGPTSMTFTYNPDITMQQWGHFSLNFVAVGPTTAISLLGESGIDYIGLDNVSVNLTATSIPEPSTLVAFSMAIVLMLAYSRCRRSG
jgi:hypothetical protein